jgi:hypothetical protein
MGKPLLATFGAEIKADGWKQMIGHVVRQIMERQGYPHDVTGLKVKARSSRGRAATRKRVGGKRSGGGEQPYFLPTAPCSASLRQPRFAAG